MNDYKNIIDAIRNFEAFKGQILLNEALAPKTTFKIGGNADVFIKPENYYSFQIVFDILLATNTKFFILGGGSNIVFSDEDFHGVVVSTQAFSDVDYFQVRDYSSDFGEIKLQKNQVLVTCFSGTSIAALVNFCSKKNISGFEEFAGLPGTVGGALFMNARCFNKSISDILFSSSYMDFSKGKSKLGKALTSTQEWDYKKSPYQDGNKFITTATFLLTQKDESQHQQIEDDCKKFISERVDKGHFKYPSAGSVFKNDRNFGKPSGKIIDEAGLKGYRIGDAQVAPFHGNFIINLGHAKAKDVKALVEYIQKDIKNKYSFFLNPEIIFVDNLY
ncbi:MAG: UDP-N-acetylmuramate dehydrogenase [Treponema sp.]|nr:UDP-N-acetylmuramate dehydrogenase [Treponema sp.]